MEPLFTLQDSAGFNPHLDQIKQQQLVANSNPAGSFASIQFNPVDTANTGSTTATASDLKWSTLHDMISMDAPPSSDPNQHPASHLQQHHNLHISPLTASQNNHGDMVDINAFIHNFSYDTTNGHFGPNSAASGSSASGSELLMHLEQLHGLRTAGSMNSPNNSSSAGSTVSGIMDWGHENSSAVGSLDPSMLHSHQTHDAFFNTGIMAQQMSTMSMSDHLPSSGSSGRYPSASSNFDAHSDTGSNISNATLTTALTAGTDFSSSMSASASSQYSDRSSLSASSALSGPGGFIYPSSNPLMSPGDALSNYSANASPFGDQIQQQQGLFLESLRNAATPPGTNMGGSGNTTPTTARRRRALTIPNSQPKTVLKAYMAGGGGHTGLHQAPPTPHPGHVLQGNNAMMDLLHTSNPLSPIPSSPFSAHPLSAGLGSAESSIPPMSARSDHTHAPLSASSATSITLPSGQPVARVPIMPLASSNKNNGPASNPDGSPMTADELFRKLDGELEKINFDDITVSELKEHLRIRALPSSGKKALLVQRLQDEIKFIQKRRDGTLRPEEDPRLPLYNHVLSIHGIQPPLPPPGTTALAMAAAAVYGGAPFNPHLGAPMHLQNPHQQFIMMSAPPSSLVSPLHSPALNMSQALPIGQQQQHAAAYQMAMAKATSAISGPTTFTSSIPNPYAATTTLPTTTTLPSPPSHTSAALPQNPSSPSSPSTHPATSPPSISSSSSPSTPPTTTSTLPHTSSPLTQRRINVARSNVVASQRQRSHSDSRTTRPRLEDLGLDPSSASSLLLANSSSLFIPPPQSKPTTSPTHSPVPLPGRPRAASSAVRPYHYQRLHHPATPSSAPSSAPGSPLLNMQRSQPTLTQIITNVSVQSAPSTAPILGGEFGAAAAFGMGPQTAAVMELAEGTMAMSLDSKFESSFFETSDVMHQ